MPTGISSYLVFRFFVGQQLKATRLFLNSPRDKRVFRRTTAGGVGTGILLTLKVMGTHFKGGGVGGGRREVKTAQKGRRFQTVFMLVRQTRIFYKECVSHSSILVARWEILGFPCLCSFLDKLLEDHMLLGSPKETQRRG